jgi:hypothetical protein
MQMSGSHRLSDMPLQNYSLDSINEFLKVETVTQDGKLQARKSDGIVNDNVHDDDVVLQSAYSFAKRETAQAYDLDKYEKLTQRYEERRPR